MKCPLCDWTDDAYIDGRIEAHLHHCTIYHPEIVLLGFLSGSGNHYGCACGKWGSMAELADHWREVMRGEGLRDHFAKIILIRAATRG